MNSNENELFKINSYKNEIFAELNIHYIMNCFEAKELFQS